MAAAGTKKSRAQLARERKWYARLWWIAFHVYDYAALAYAGSLSPTAQGASDFATCVVVAVINVCVYARLQTSSPGYLSLTSAQRARRLEEGDDAKAAEGEATPAAAAAGEADAEELLVTRAAPNSSESVDMGVAGATRYCDNCQNMQPMRTKHCKDCDRCVLQYDHHCDCAGTCIGRNNRRLFMLYLFMQMLEGLQLIGVATSAFTLQSTLDDWLVANTAFVVVWFSVLVVLLITIPLLGYHVYLISSNQTSWEHARRAAITYLQHLPDDKSPFDRGVVRNWWTFLSGGNSDVWVHATAKPRHSLLRRPAAGDGGRDDQDALDDAGASLM